MIFGKAAALFLWLLCFEPFTYYVIREGVLLKLLCLIVGMERREVEMLIYANRLESEAHLIGIQTEESTVNRTGRNCNTLFFYKNKVCKTIEARNLLSLGII